MQAINRQIGQNLGELTREFELITHNLANVNTAGYKRRTNAFTAALEAQKDRAAGKVSGLVERHERLDFTPGPLVRTERPLDVALDGPGFFVVEDPQGPRYTRAGQFSVNANGQLVDAAGRLVSGTGGPITLPPGTDVSQVGIRADGSITVADQTFGRLQVVGFTAENQQRLVPVGDALYAAPTGVTPDPLQTPHVVQGAQEGSNVKAVEELVGMINVTRLYQAHVKFATARREASKSLMSVAMG